MIMKENKTPQPSNPIPGNAPFFSKEKERDVERADSPEPFFTKPALRLKAEVSQPDDPQEREADQVADKVLRKSSSPIEPEERKRQKVNRKTKINGLDGVSPSAIEKASTFNSEGIQIPKDTQLFFNRQFGVDFSSVRLHTDDRASESAKEIRAKAYTTRNHIAFAQGEYSPETEHGKWLLAHELTHVIQQSESGNFSSGATIQRFDGNDWREEHEAAQQEAARSAAEGEMMVEGDTELFQGFVLSADGQLLEKVLKAVISMGGFSAARNFVMEYNFNLGLSGKQHALRKNIRPLLEAKFNELSKKGQDFVAIKFGPTLYDHLIKLLIDSKKIIDKEAERYGLSSKLTFSGRYNTVCFPRMEYSIENNAETQNMGITAALILEKYEKLETLKKKRESYEETNYRMIPGDPEQKFGNGPKWEKAGVTITDPVAYKQLGEEIKLQQQEYISVLSKGISEHPILASYQPPKGIEGLKAISGKSTYARDREIGSNIVEKQENIQKILEVAGDDRFMWKQPSLIAGTKNILGVQPGTIEFFSVDEKVNSIAQDELIRNLSLGFISLIGTALAAIPTGGGSIVAVAATGIGGGMLAGSAGASILIGIQNYELEKAASGTNFDKAKAISQTEPGLFWLAFDIVAAIADLGSAAKLFAKSARVMRSVEDTHDWTKAAKNAYREAELGSIMPEKDFVKNFLIHMKADTEIFGATVKARARMLESLKTGSHPHLMALVGGEENALIDLAKSHGKWEGLIVGLEGGNKEMQTIAVNLVNYREKRVFGWIKDQFQGDLLPTASRKSTSDFDIKFARTKKGAGEKMILVETEMYRRYGPGWDEIWRMNFYTDLKTRLLLPEQYFEKMSDVEKAKFLLEQHNTVDKLNLARQIQNAGSDVNKLKLIEQEAKQSGYNFAEIKMLADTTEDVVKARRNALNLKIDALEDAFVSAKDEIRKTQLAKEIQQLQMQANFYSKEAVISPGSAKNLIQDAKINGLQLSDAIMEWLVMLEHKVHEYGGAKNALFEYEPWKYMDRDIKFALQATIDPELRMNLEVIKNRAQYIQEIEHSWAKQTSHIGGELNVAETNLKMYQEFIDNMRSIAVNIRNSELTKLKAMASQP
jgi:hypothetical protein